ncbi:MAG: 7-carboxy-7-deazaguanine synthase QueE [Planctomycetes bacterium]|nr:7-carboxy-7-deazaguanine synthase QueE [Planctomycetota bacterium]
MRVSETFRSLQGEGPSAGAPATFLRLQGCSVGCRWCDSRYTWDLALGREVGMSEQLAELTGLGPCDLLVITGGEPLEVQGFEEFAAAACGCWSRVEVETSGVRCPPMSLPNLYWNWSPKLPSATPRWESTWAHAAAWMAEPRAIAKIVVGPEDAADARRLALSLPRDRVWLMPEAMTAEVLRERSAALAEICQREGWRLSPRLHVWLWGARRGI